MSKKQQPLKEEKIAGENKRNLPQCIHCGKDGLKLVIPVVTLADSDKKLYECEFCNERQYE